jgi:Ca2+-binding EF-hand superfamily protein
MSATNIKPSPLEIGARLFSTPKESEKGIREQADALVCDLPTHTLRWIKKRRNENCEQKVVLSHQRERQLREMFESLDFEGNGEIDLPALTEAVYYVQEKTKNSKGMKDFHNIHEVFAAMDDNGDGTIDFTEFTRGMTGTMKSAFDKATEYDIDRLFRYFVQFGELRQRDMALRKLNIINTDDSVSTTSRRTNGTGGSKKASHSTKHKSNTNAKEKPATSSTKSGDKFLVKGDTDIQTYQQFKILFGNPVNANATVGSATNQTVGLAGESSSLIASAHEIGSGGNMNGSVDSISRNNSTNGGNGGVTIVGLPKSPKKNEFRNLFKVEKLLDDFISDYEINAQDQVLSPTASNYHTDSAIKPSQDGSVSKSEKAMNSLQSFTSAHHKYHPSTSYYNSYTHQFLDQIDFEPEKFDEYKKIHEKLKVERREEYEVSLVKLNQSFLLFC